MRSMGRIIDDLETALESIEEEWGLILKYEFMMLIFQGIIGELPPFEKYWTQMFQNNSTPVVGECRSKVLTFTILYNYLFSPDDGTNKNTCAMIGEMAVTADKALLSKIWDGKNPRQIIYQVLGEDYVGMIHLMLTMRLVCSKFQSMIPLKDILAQCQSRFSLIVK